MATDSPTLFGFVQEGIDVRRKTLDEVIAGQKGLLERRFEIVDRRQSTFLETRSERSTKTAENHSNKGLKSDKSHQGPSGVEPSPNVSITLDSSTAEEIRAANALSKMYPDAREILLSDEVVEVHKESGETISIDVSEILEEESEDEITTSEASTPSMSSVASSWQK